MRTKETTPAPTVRRAGSKSGAREVWQISEKGGTRTVITSGTSAKSLDEAMVRFDTALKRLADR